jgi:hypothetical protein
MYLAKENGPWRVIEVAGTWISLARHKLNTVKAQPVAGLTRIPGEKS